MRSTAEYVGCAHVKCDKSSLPMPISLFCCCYWLAAPVRMCPATVKIWCLLQELTCHVGWFETNPGSGEECQPTAVCDQAGDQLVTIKQQQAESMATAAVTKICHILHEHNPHSELCCSFHKCMFLTNGAPFKRGIIKLSNGLKCSAKKYCYNREIIHQTQIAELFVPSLCETL